MFRLLCALTIIAALVPSPAAAQAPTTSVVRVIDGDTIDVLTPAGIRERVRVIGIDTPESLDPRSPVKCFGLEASDRARELLTGRTIALEPDASQDARDRYGRLLAHVRLPDGGLFGQVMIGEGLAHHYVHRAPSAHAPEFAAAQESAQANRLGLWAPGACAGQAAKPDLDDDAETPVIPAAVVAGETTSSSTGVLRIGVATHADKRYLLAIQSTDAPVAFRVRYQDGYYEEWTTPFITEIVSSDGVSTGTHLWQVISRLDGSAHPLTAFITEIDFLPAAGPYTFVRAAAPSVGVSKPPP